MKKILLAILFVLLTGCNKNGKSEVDFCIQGIPAYCHIVAFKFAKKKDYINCYKIMYYSCKELKDENSCKTIEIVELNGLDGCKTNKYDSLSLDYNKGYDKGSYNYDKGFSYDKGSSYDRGSLGF